MEDIIKEEQLKQDFLEQFPSEEDAPINPQEIWEWFKNNGGRFERLVMADRAEPTCDKCKHYFLENESRANSRGEYISWDMCRKHNEMLCWDINQVGCTKFEQK